MLQIGEAVGSLVAPMLGSLLLLIFDIDGIIIIDFATFIFALSILLLVQYKPLRLLEKQLPDVLA